MGIQQRVVPSLATCVLVLGVCSCENTRTGGREFPEPTSIVTLIASPESYHGRLVMVKGFVSLEFEGSAVYLREEDYRRGITKNGVWLLLEDFEDSIPAAVRECHLAYCLLEGRFDASILGHLGMWSGALGEIQRAQVMGYRHD